MQRRTLILAGLAAPAAVSLAGLSRAQDAAGYPNRAVTIVVPFAAGGSADVIVRAMAVEMGRAWGQNVIVDNRAGGNTIIATSYVVSAPPDGYTILCGSYAWVTNQYLVAKLPYTPAALAPVTLLGEYPEMLFLRGDIPASNVAELAAYARSQGKPLNFANSGPGSSLHLAAAGFADAANIPAIHVPYRGSAPAMQDLAGGRIDAMFEGLSFKPFADGKRVKAMFVAQPESLAEWPELPTSRQAGLDGFRMASWFGLLVPAKTPDAIQQRISQAVVAALQKPAIDAQLRKLGLIPAPGTPAEYTAFLDRERTKLQAVISRNRIVID
jgi:tripartite-type tricarboxylate transporter receptor subunit TctC